MDTIIPIQEKIEYFCDEYKFNIFTQMKNKEKKNVNKIKKYFFVRKYKVFEQTFTSVRCHAQRMCVRMRNTNDCTKLFID